MSQKSDGTSGVDIVRRSISAAADDTVARRRDKSQLETLLLEWQDHINDELFAALLEATATYERDEQQCLGGHDHDTIDTRQQTGRKSPLLPRRVLICFLSDQGLLEDDERIRTLMECLSASDDDLAPADLSPLSPVGAAARKDPLVTNVIWKAIYNRLIIPKFAEFTSMIREMYEECLSDTSGANAQYIPQLAQVNPDQFGVGVCTIDGQRYSIGDVNVPFTLQSCSKVVTYAIAQTIHGPNKVHEHVGVEPSGQAFNQMVLDERAKHADLRTKRELMRGGNVDEADAMKVRPAVPHNPCINAGAIMCASLVLPGASADERFDHVMDTWTKLCGASPKSKTLRPPTFSASTYISERSTADRNFCLSYMMKEEGAFLDGTDILATLDSYFMYCSIEVTVQTLSVVAGTFANGGTCPITGFRIFDHNVVRNCLSVMQSAGMYDYSGTFAYRMGFPAKSGVSGALLVVIPGVCGFATWSPRLDEIGNSARGIRFCKLLSQQFAFHMFLHRTGADNARAEDGESRDDGMTASYISKMTPLAKRRRGKSVTKVNIDPSRPLAVKKTSQISAEETIDLLWAAKDGDIDAVQQIIARGISVNSFDYDLRTALQIAVSENYLGLVMYLLRLGADPLAVDKFGGTAVTYANQNNIDKDIALMLEKASTTEKSLYENVGMPYHGVSPRTKSIFFSLLALVPVSEGFTVDLLRDVLWRNGISSDDDRVKYMLNELPPSPEVLTPLHLEKATSCPIVLRALQGDLVIPDWQFFLSECSSCFKRAQVVTTGNVANYIPILAKVDPDKFGVSVCSVDGQRLSIGDCKDAFGVQSSMKPLNFGIALETTSFRKVIQHVGIEPSGRPFNEMVLDQRRVDLGETDNHCFPGCSDCHDEEDDDDDFDARFDDHGLVITPTAVPHNPCINAGAIMCSAIIDEGKSVTAKLATIEKYWSRLTAGRKDFEINEEMYLSESEHADRNRCLAYMMKEADAFPELADLETELEFYFKCCSQMQNAESMAIVAGTLANGGVCPITNERIFSLLTVQSVLSVMFTCGMYDFSGQFAFSMGFPAKSGVGGSILMVVPGVMGICTFSPRLDGNGNSCRGIAFATHLADVFELHVFDEATETLLDRSATKQDLRFRRDKEIRDLVAELSIAAVGGDRGTVMRFSSRYGSQLLNLSDYDKRTALHLACSVGQAGVVKHLVEQPGIDLAPVDRWGTTPLDDARKNGSKEVIQIMENALRANTA